MWPSQVKAPSVPERYWNGKKVTELQSPFQGASSRLGCHQALTAGSWFSGWSYCYVSNSEENGSESPTTSMRLDLFPFQIFLYLILPFHPFSHPYHFSSSPLLPSPPSLFSFRTGDQGIMLSGQTLHHWAMPQPHYSSLSLKLLSGCSVILSRETEYVLALGQKSWGGRPIWSCAVWWCRNWWGEGRRWVIPQLLD